jgi:hypothetical protein
MGLLSMERVLWLKKSDTECLSRFQKGLVLRGERKPAALGQFQIGSIVGAALVQPGLIENCTKRMIQPIKVNSDGELLQVPNELGTPLRRNLLSSFRHHERIDDLKPPDGRHNDIGAIDHSLERSVGIWRALILETPSGAY